LARSGVVIALSPEKNLISQWVRDRQELGWVDCRMDPLASSSIMSTTSRVSFGAVGGAVGITAGAIRYFSRASNGLPMGALAALELLNIIGYPGWAVVVLRRFLVILPARLLAGGAGLLIGRAILFPGLNKYRRADAAQVYSVCRSGTPHSATNNTNKLPFSIFGIVTQVDLLLVLLRACSRQVQLLPSAITYAY
jgi:uncharacterized membrane protein SpoIIM required for sporulation